MILWSRNSTLHHLALMFVVMDISLTHHDPFNPHQNYSQCNMNFLKSEIQLCKRVVQEFMF